MPLSNQGESFGQFDPKRQGLAQRGMPDARGTRGQLPIDTRHGPPVKVYFKNAVFAADVPHHLGEEPDGFHVVQSDALIRRFPGKPWTKEVAYLEADVAPSFAVLIFYKLREGIIEVNTP